jgi:DNA-binding winged helix-turn-helix (wHTH) protein
MTSQVVSTKKVVSLEAHALLRFDAFQLLPRRRVLLRNDDFIPIGGRAFDLLLALVSCAGEIVSHDELIQIVWPARVVSSCNLKTQVMTLQRALGLTPEGNRYIKSVALRGYVFVADVHTLPSDRPQTSALGWRGEQFVGSMLTSLPIAPPCGVST